MPEKEKNRLACRRNSSELKETESHHSPFGYSTRIDANESERNSKDVENNCRGLEEQKALSPTNVFLSIQSLPYMVITQSISMSLTYFLD